ncbi:hypothetical protein AMST5_03905 [freshwater sediment metagenome]|uniref:Methyltransferase domain-containing protein n=1 Tax=freshwater sediment metagenome TaxID=556182 RepID=A0AA48M2X1_9ZZZZ
MRIDQKAGLVEKEFETDKSQAYLDNYRRFFSPLRDASIKLLEIGVYQGGSLLLWRDYFERGDIVGIDINPVKLDQEIDRVSIYQGSQDDSKLCAKIVKERAPEGFDIIVEDASHFGSETLATFDLYFKQALKPGGIYVIEDWGTGYWSKWKDGHDFIPHTKTWSGRFRSHDYGMVGVVKQIADYVAASDINNLTMTRRSNVLDFPCIEEITIFHGQVFIRKGK